MTRLIDSIFAVIDKFDVAVLDQWGVLHRGDGAFPWAIESVTRLAREGKRIVVLTNSGKRAAVNRKRIQSLGFPEESIEHVVSSGEVAWSYLRGDEISPGATRPGLLFPMCAANRDAQDWAGGDPSIVFADHPEHASNLLLMGTEDDAAEDEFDGLFETAIRREIGMICTNPDKVSLRGERRIIAPGFLAQRFASLGGSVVWFGKPFPKVFDAVRSLYPEIPRQRFLMIGDSMEHDIAGANCANFLSALVMSGVHKPALEVAKSERELQLGVEALSKEHGTASPDFCVERLR